MGALTHRFLKTAARKQAVHQAPLDGALPFDAFGQRGENVGQIAAHLAFIDHAREAAGAGQHAQKWDFGQADRGVWLKTPPPSWAVLPVNVDVVTVSVPLLLIAPPEVPVVAGEELPVKVDPLTDSVPWL